MAPNNQLEAPCRNMQVKNLALSVMGPLLARLRGNVSSLKMHFSLDLSFLQIGGVVGLLLRSYD